jgi:hypothetical protein
MGTDQEYLIEYRTPTRWDRAFSEPTLLVHSHGLPFRQAPLGSVSLVNEGDTYYPITGHGRIWFERAIPAPFHDAWSISAPSISVEVVGRYSEDKAIAVRIASPGNAKSARLFERDSRADIGRAVVAEGVVELSQETDPNLCDAALKPYGYTIERFGEEVHLDLQLKNFQIPVIEKWTINGYDIAATASTTPFDRTVEATATVRAETVPGLLPHLITQTAWTTAQLEATPLPYGILVRSVAGIGYFTLLVEVTVGDAGVLAGVPGAFPPGRFPPIDLSGREVIGRAFSGMIYFRIPMLTPPIGAFNLIRLPRRILGDLSLVVPGAIMIVPPSATAPTASARVLKG